MNKKQKTIQHITLLTLGGFCCYILFLLIHNSLHFLKIKTFTNENLAPILDTSFQLHSFFIIFTIILSFVSIAKKNITLTTILSIIVISYFFPVYQWIDNYLHPQLTHIGFYSFLTENKSVINPQYTKIILFSISISTLLILCFIKKTRNIDRIFVLTISCSVIITTTIFHSLIPMGFFQLTKQQAAISFAIQSTNQSDSFCKTYICTNYLDMKDKSSPLHKYLTQIEPAIEQAIQKQKNSITFYNDFEGLRFDYDIVLISPKNNKTIIYINNIDIRPLSRMSETVFMLLSAYAHALWLLGGLSLLLMHKLLFFKRKRV